MEETTILDEEPFPCPYRSICNCPGDGVTRLGFKLRVGGGLVCLTHKIELEPEQIQDLRTSEGKHLVDAVEAADKIDAAHRKYSRSEKARANQRKYNKSEAGRASFKRITKTEKYKIAQRKFYYSPKGIEARLRRQEKVKDFKQIEKWLKANPGKTVEDYWKEKDNGSGGPEDKES